MNFTTHKLPFDPVPLFQAGKILKTCTVALLMAYYGVAGLAQATPTLPSNLFDPNETQWYSVRNLTSQEFANRFNQYKNAGQMLVDIDIDAINGDYRVSGVFQKNLDGRAWSSLRNLTNAQFHAEWLAKKAAGFRLVAQESYSISGQQRYAGIWIDNRENYSWASYRDVTSAEFSAKFDTYKAAGMLPIDVDVYQTPQGTRYAAVWVQNAENLRWALRRGLNSQQYAETFDNYSKDGLRSLVIDSIRLTSGQFYAGIWLENKNGRGWFAYRDMTSTGFRNRWNQLTDMGFRLIDTEAYDTAAGVRYAGVFRQNSARHNWQLRTKVDNLVQAELNKFKVPGISVSVAHNGKLVYLRGFGKQDENGVWMHGETVQRLASVSKAITGVLAFRVADKHPAFKWSDRIRKYVPTLPTHHSYTVAQALKNLSCVVSYPDGFSNNQMTHYNSTLDAIEDFQDQALGCTPGGSYLYSTAAYTVAAAALERLEGKPFSSILSQELNQRFKLSTLRTDNHSVFDYTTLYGSNDNKPFTPDDLSWKQAGGGMQASAKDMAYLGMGLLNGSILNAMQREAMWIPSTIRNYAYGWEVKTQSGHRVFGKTGGQPGANSYLMILPDDGLVITVLSNRWKGGHNSGTLSQAIAGLVINQN
jgi:CubicO group peptidase (beta-lactamase class C family)